TQSIDGTVGTADPVELGQGNPYTLTLGAVTQAGVTGNVAVQTYTVNWGDGTSSAYATAGAKSHVYYRTGVFNPTVDLTAGATTFFNAGEDWPSPWTSTRCSRP